MSAPVPLVLDDPDRVGLVAAHLVANRLRAHPAARLILPTGRTPLSMYAALRALAASERLAARGATLLQLDEYLGVPPGDPRSFNATLRRETAPLGFGTVHGIDGAAADAEAEAARHQALIDAAPIHLAVLGLGRDGHVAFDEPGTNRMETVHPVRLHPVTIADAAAEFGGADAVPRRALTVGLRALADTHELVLLVTGENKAEALHGMLEAPMSPDRPASLLRHHPRLTVIADRAAASRLAPRPQWRSDKALIVLGHREPGKDRVHLVSEESFARIRRAAAIARREPVRLAVLTGWTRTGGLSEAEQMKPAWPDDVAPALLEDAGRNTAENATRSLPLLLATGVVRRVDVVTSGWHLRARWFFRIYRRDGLEVRVRPAFRRGNWLRMLAAELVALPSMRRQLRAALAEEEPR